MCNIGALVAVYFKLFVPAVSCSSDLDCSLNGLCNRALCECDSGWKGDRCSSLDLQPIAGKARNFDHGLHLSNTSTWGGSVQKASDGLYHMWAATMKNHCGLHTWKSNSAIVHAVSVAPGGPYAAREQVVDAWSHNPQVIRAPDGNWLMYYIGNGAGEKNKQCVNGSTPRKSHFDDLSVADGGKPPAPGNFYYHRASSPLGPWEQRTAFSELWSRNANPAPLVFENGTLLMAINANGITLIRAESWDANWTLVREGVFGGEDPFLWRDDRGHFHMLYHHKPYGNDTFAGGHAFSVDGYDWTVNTEVTFSGEVQYTEETSPWIFGKRERPKLIFEKGVPTHLINGVLNLGCFKAEPNSWNCSDGAQENVDDYTWTLVQPIGSRRATATVVV